MKAMLLAAGLGTRLKPLTDHCPKALVKVGGQTLLERSIRYLKRNGVEEVVVNVHHFADQVEAFLLEYDGFGLPWSISDEREQLLDTGGGLKKAAGHFAGGGPFIVCNVDVLTDLNLERMYHWHLDSGVAATLAVQHRDSSRCFLFDADRRLVGWRNRSTGETRWCNSGWENQEVTELAFSGIQILDPVMFEYFPEESVFSLVEWYLRAGGEQVISGFLHDDSHWMDAGKIRDLSEAEALIRKIEKS